MSYIKGDNNDNDMFTNMTSSIRLGVMRFDYHLPKTHFKFINTCVCIHIIHNAQQNNSHLAYIGRVE